MASALQKEFEFFLAHKEELLKQYQGKFVVISGQKVIGVYTDEITAINETKKTIPLGTFLVQIVEPGDAAYTQSFHSRVSA
jgi:hypothetical protein